MATKGSFVQRLDDMIGRAKDPELRELAELVKELAEAQSRDVEAARRTASDAARAARKASEGQVFTE